MSAIKLNRQCAPGMSQSHEYFEECAEYERANASRGRATRMRFYEIYTAVLRLFHFSFGFGLAMRRSHTVKATIEPDINSRCCATLG